MRDLYLTPVRRLFAFALLVLLLSQAAISWFAWSVIEEQIRPELDRKALTVAISVNNKIIRALDYGIPFDRLAGIQDFFEQILKENDDLAYLVIVDTAGKAMHASGLQAEQLGAALPGVDAAATQQVGLPVHLPSSVSSNDRQASNFLDTPVVIRHHGEVVGFLHVGVDQSFIASRISGLRYDIGIILLTSMLIAFEVLLFIISLNYLEPMRQIAELMGRMAAGDFSYLAIVTVKESIGSLAARLNRIGVQMNLHYTALVQNAAEAATRGPGQGVAAGALLARLRAAYVFADDGGTRGLVQQRIVSIRILTFLFMFAEMLSRSFLPLYVGTLPGPGFGIAGDFAASIPITAYLLGVACSLPFAGRWSDRTGRRSSYTLGAAILIAGLLCTGLANGFYGLVLARVISGAGYALMFMACQGYVIDNTDDSNRSQGIAAFVSAIMVAEICAPAVGGILADRIGYQLVFVFGAVIALLAALLAIRTLDNSRARGVSDVKQRGGAFALLLKNSRFMAISILVGIPAKLLLSGFLIYLVPVILTGLNSSKSEIGRYAMLYGILTLSLTPLFAHFADRFRAHAWMVGVGGLLTGAALLPILFEASTGNVLLGIAALGFGQAMSISAQLGLVTKVTKAEAATEGATAVLGIFRLIERLGGAAGPAIAGALAALVGPARAMAALGALGVVSSVLFLIIFAISNARSGESGVTGHRGVA